MLELMGHFSKADCQGELTKKCGSESHKPQAFIGNIEFKAVTKFLLPDE